MSSNDTLCYPFLRHQIVIIIIPWIDQINDESLAFYFVFRALKSVKLMNRCSSNAASSWLQAVAQITSNFIKCYSEKMRDCDKIVRTDSNTSWLFYRYRFYCDFTMRLEHVQIHSQTVLEKEISFGSIWVQFKSLVEQIALPSLLKLHFELQYRLYTPGHRDAVLPSTTKKGSVAPDNEQLSNGRSLSYCINLNR